MTKAKTVLMILLITFSYAFGQDEIKLREELKILQPLTGKSWVSVMTDPSGQKTLHLSQYYEPMYSGKVLKSYRECKELNYQSNGFIYYNPDTKEIEELQLSSNGNMSKGNVKEEDGKLLFYGYTIFPDSKREFRNTYEITPDGKIIDKYFSIDNGKWKAGHARVWTVN